MSLLSLKISNYRSVAFDNPIELSINEGITFIVGINNVGKSNLLRMFFELRPVFSNINFHMLTNGGKMEIGLEGVYSDNILNQNSKCKTLRLELSTENFYLAISMEPKSSQSHTDIFSITCTLSSLLSNEKQNDVIDYIVKLFRGSLLMPSLRTASAIGIHQIRDIAVGAGLVQRFNNWRTGDEVEKRNKCEVLINELKDLFEFKTFNIWVSADRSHLQVRTDDGTFRLDELGEGIGHFIVVLANAVFQEPHFIFIDEPEASLHPRLQEVFVRTLASKARFGLIATSHSIGLARSVADNIYTLTRQSDGHLRLFPFGQHQKETIAQSIYEMGYSQFVELGGNNILLVEGRTDIKSFREILRKYGIEKDFIIWQLGGSAFITPDSTSIVEELNEIRRLNAKSIFLIFDSERTAPLQPLKQEFAIFKQTCEELDFNVFATDYHSTENYITQAAIDAVLGNSYRQLTPFEPFQNRSNKWSKNKNWLMFREMKKEDFAGTELDVFIQQKLLLAAAS